MEKINNYEIYNYRMKKSLLDKLFFLDKFFEPVANIVDFGCADGEIIDEMKHIFPEYNYVGYDNDETMLKLARAKDNSVKYYSNWDDINIDFNESLLNISSTIHEVYSYGNEEDYKIFWERVFSSGFKYICIRDMMLSENLEENVKKEDIRKLREYNSEMVNDYEKIWGSLNKKKNFIHYLLKYKYIENWNREVRENYFPITVEYLLNVIPKNYKITYIDHFILPYIANQIKKDFDIELDTKTHLKIILEKIEN